MTGKGCNIWTFAGDRDPDDTARRPAPAGREVLNPAGIPSPNQTLQGDAMKPRTWMLALALSTAGLCSTSSFAQVTGTVKLDGAAPEPAQIDMSTTKECAEAHPDGVFDESIVVNDGKIQNVVVSI